MMLCWPLPVAMVVADSVALHGVRPAVSWSSRLPARLGYNPHLTVLEATQELFWQGPEVRAMGPSKSVRCGYEVAALRVVLSAVCESAG